MKKLWVLLLVLTVAAMYLVLLEKWRNLPQPEPVVETVLQEELYIRYQQRNRAQPGMEQYTNALTVLICCLWKWSIAPWPLGGGEEWGKPGSFPFLLKRNKLCEFVTEERPFRCYNEATKKNKTQNNKEEKTMKYVCGVCGWEYNEAEGYPEGGIAPGTKWEDIPEDFECPLCSVAKDMFNED